MVRSIGIDPGDQAVKVVELEEVVASVVELDGTLVEVLLSGMVDPLTTAEYGDVLLREWARSR